MRFRSLIPAKPFLEDVISTTTQVRYIGGVLNGYSASLRNKEVITKVFCGLKDRIIRGRAY